MNAHTREWANGRTNRVRIVRAAPFVVIALVMALLAPALAGCGGKAEAEKTLDARGLAEALIGGVAFEDQMEEATADAFRALYAIDPSDEAVKDFVLYTSTGATAEEVSVIEARDAESARAVLDSVRARVEAQKTEFENYAPAEMAKLNDPVILSSGKYVILCLSNDNAAAEAIIGEFVE